MLLINAFIKMYELFDKACKIINIVYSRCGSGGERRARDEFNRRRDRAKDIKIEAGWPGITLIQVRREQGDEQRHGSQEGLFRKAKSIHRKRRRCRYVLLLELYIFIVSTCLNLFSTIKQIDLLLHIYTISHLNISST